VDEPISIRDSIKLQPFAAQANRTNQAPRQERLVDHFPRIRGQHAHGDPRMAIVEAPPDPLALSVKNIDHNASWEAAGRFLDHLLKDPRVSGAPGDLQTHLG
jgi:hypothetical protein